MGSHPLSIEAFTASITACVFLVMSGHLASGRPPAGVPDILHQPRELPHHEGFLRQVRGDGALGRRRAPPDGELRHRRARQHTEPRRLLIEREDEVGDAEGPVCADCRPR